jgi:hypothetical protein
VKTRLFQGSFAQNLKLKDGSDMAHFVQASGSLNHHLKTLRLPTFLSEYDNLARQCAAKSVDNV